MEDIHKQCRNIAETLETTRLLLEAADGEMDLSALYGHLCGADELVDVIAGTSEQASPIMVLRRQVKELLMEVVGQTATHSSPRGIGL